MLDEWRSPDARNAIESAWRTSHAACDQTMCNMGVGERMAWCWGCTRRAGVQSLICDSREARERRHQKYHSPEGDRGGAKAASEAQRRPNHGRRARGRRLSTERHRAAARLRESWQVELRRHALFDTASVRRGRMRAMRSQADVLDAADRSVQGDRRRARQNTARERAVIPAGRRRRAVAFERSVVLMTGNARQSVSAADKLEAGNADAGRTRGDQNSRRPRRGKTPLPSNEFDANLKPVVKLQIMTMRPPSRPTWAPAWRTRPALRTATRPVDSAGSASNLMGGAADSDGHPEAATTPRRRLNLSWPTSAARRHRHT